MRLFVMYWALYFLIIIILLFIYSNYRRRCWWFIDSTNSSCCGGNSGDICNGTCHHPTGPEDAGGCEVCNILIHYSFLFRTRSHNIADQSDIYEVIDKEQDERRDETFSKISTTDTTNSQSKLTLSQCPAYVPVNSPSATRGEEDVEDKKNVVYETVNPTWQFVYINIAIASSVVHYCTAEL